MDWMLKGKRSRDNHASIAGKNPLARSTELSVEEVKNELLVYDHETARAHCLGETAARVWRACDGHTDEAVIASRLDMDSDTVARALDELETAGLLVSPPSAGATRREFSKRSAKVGAAAVAAPLIMSIMAPVAEAAVTPTPAQCMQYNDKSCSACTDICGCCCCCQGSAQGDSACKLCYPIGLCPAYSFTNSTPTCGPKNQSPNCSATAKAPPRCTPAGTRVGCTYVG